MCLITSQRKPKVAKKDIVAYKLFKINDEELVSPYQGFTYEKGKPYSTELLDSEEWKCFDDMDVDYLESQYPKWRRGGDKRLRCIGQGFHAVTTYGRLREVGDTEEILEVIIPKGSLYYTDKTNLIVSNQIIIPQ